MNDSKTVFVGLSGGVDSSVAALRLINQGYNVVGVFIKVWHPDFLVCNWEAERLDAMRVAAKLNIPFLTCDAVPEYRDAVAHYFIEEYRAGRTPNPDVMCNKEVKFGAFLKFALERGAEFVATGHYARRATSGDTEQILRGVDGNKDQTYFLWTLDQNQLTKTLFPVGDSPKDVIRKEAEEAGLLTADKRDSQGVCFLGHIDIPDFLSHYIDLKEGNVLDDEGEVIGSHKGAFVYTIGQRHGFLLNEINSERTPYYVTHKNIENNTITVSKHKPSLQTSFDLVLKQININEEITVGDTIEAQTRYRQKPFLVKIKSITLEEIRLVVEGETDAVALGQSCVLYRDEVCLGGGIIS